MKTSIITRLSDAPQRTATAEISSLPHVLLVVDGFPRVLGGGERVVLRLANLLPSYGFRVSILTLSLPPDTAFRPAKAPCPVYLLPLTNTYGLAALKGAFALRAFLRQQEIKIVQTFFESSDLWAGTITRLFSPAKLIWSRRDMGILRGKKHEQAYRALRNLPHAVIAVSERVAEHVKAEDGVSPARVYVVHNGLDLDVSAVPRKPVPSTDAVITTIGNVRKVKGHDVLVQAARCVLARYPSVTFTIAGEILEPAFFDDLERVLQADGLQQRIRFLGKVTDLHKHLLAADLFVLPSRSEGFSNALIEAMAAGLPCVATDVGGNAEAVEHGNSGLIVPPESPDALAQAVLRLLDDPDFARDLGDTARRSAEENFSSASMLQRTVSIYRSLLG